MRKSILLLLLLCVCLVQSRADGQVTMSISSRVTTLKNGLLTVKIAADGTVSSITMPNGDAVINASNTSKTGERGYFSYVSGELGTAELKATNVRVVTETDDMAEVVYYNNSNAQQWNVGYIMRKDVCGLYVYFYLSGVSRSGATDQKLEEARMVWRVNPSLFNYAWVSDSQQGTMPTPAQMAAYVKELQDATYQLADGSVYTKYDWATFMRDSQLYGLMGRNSSGVRLGVWNITPSFEWISGGADKQDLTVHATDTSPLMLQMIQSRHFGGDVLSFGEDQQKLYGPYLIYMNSGATQDELTADAKSRAAAETAAWPYSWFDNDLYPISRATVTGRIVLQDNFGTTRLRVALAQPVSNPLVQGTDYQYWAETDAEGNFTIDKVRPGSYALYAYALNGSATGKLVTDSYVITAGDNALGDIAWQPAKYEELLWQIGATDHSTAGFCLSDHARQYGLWNQVPADLTYTVGTSNPQTDWYYAQTQEGTWTVNFTTTKTYSEPLHLTIATAGASGSGAKLEVKFNGNEPLQDIQYDNDAGVYRSAVLGGRDSTVVIEVPASQIVNGANTMTLRLWNKPSNGLGGIMYDCIKLEAGSTTTAIRSLRNEKTDDESAVYDLYGRRHEKGSLAPGVYITNGRKQIIK